MSKILLTDAELRANDGKKVTCVINGNKIEDAMIHVENGDIYILQNKMQGESCNIKKNYQYSWDITNYDDQYHWDCENIQLLDESSSRPNLIDGWLYLGPFDTEEAKQYIGRQVRFGDSKSQLAKDRTAILEDISKNSDYPYSFSLRGCVFIGVNISKPIELTKKQICEKFGVDDFVMTEAKQ